MSPRSLMWLALPVFGAACAIPGKATVQSRAFAEMQDPQPTGSEPNESGDEGEPQGPGDQGDDDAPRRDSGSLGVFKPSMTAEQRRIRRQRNPQLRAGSQPGRLRQPINLREEGWALQFRLERTSGGSSLFPSLSSQTNTMVSASYGVTDDLMVSAQYADGRAYETISPAAAPGDLFIAGAQYKLLESGGMTIAGRTDVVLSDTSSFEAKGTPENMVSIQPGILTNFRLSDSVDLYTNSAVRWTDGTAPAFAFGAGIIAPLGKVDFFLEADAVIQNTPGSENIVDSYLTPGVRFVLRDKVDINVAPSIGLSDTSLDWRFAVTLGVHF